MRAKGHLLVDEIIAKHGVNRYRTPEANFIKLLEELGELAKAYIKRDSAGIRKEYADVGLVLYGLGNVLGLDLNQEMETVVRNETRRFDEKDEYK